MAVNLTIDVEDLTETQVQITIDAGAPVTFRGAATVEGNRAICWRGDTVYFRIADSDIWLCYDVPRTTSLATASHDWKMATGA